MTEGTPSRGAALLAVLLVASCGDPDASAPEEEELDDRAGDATALTCAPESGSRLRTVVRAHEDGSDVLGAYDAELDVRCRFQRVAGDDSLRCLPEQWSVYYLDEACTDPIARSFARPEGPPPRYVSHRPSQSGPFCAHGHVVYELGEALEDDPELLYFRSASGECHGFAIAAEPPLFRVVRELDPEELVEGTVSPVGGRITIDEIRGADGSRWCDAFSLQDTDLGARCELSYDEEGAMRCLPHGAYSEMLFDSDDCSAEMRIALTREGCGPATRYTLEPGHEVCPFRRRVLSLGAEVSSTLYWRPVEECTQFPLFDDEVPRLLGFSINSTSFIEFTRAFGPQGARLTRGDLVSPDGLRISRGQWMDLRFDMPCSFETAADGEQRCLPRAAYAVTRYSDAECTEPVTVAYADGAGSCDEAPDGSLAIVRSEGQARVVRVDGPAAGPLYQLTSSCVAVPDPTSFLMVGAEEIAPAAFAPAEVVIDL